MAEHDTPVGYKKVKVRLLKEWRWFFPGSEFIINDRLADIWCNDGSCEFLEVVEDNTPPPPPKPKPAKKKRGKKAKAEDDGPTEDDQTVNEAEVEPKPAGMSSEMGL